MNLIKNLKGCGPAIVTPFTSSGEVDVAALKRLIDFQIKGGIDFIVPCGTTGESVTLSLEESLLVVDTIVQKTEKKIPIIAGAGGYNTDHVIRTAREMQQVGADAILSVAPYYNKPTQEGLYQHFKAIAESIEIPIVLYNIPSRTGINIFPETVLRLAEIDNIIAIKEATGNIKQMTQQAMIYPDEFIMLSGDDANTLPLIALGGRGVISVAANEIPDQMRKLTHLCLEGEFESARNLQKTLYPLLRANFLETNPIPVKAALTMMGLIEESYRLPMVPMQPANREKLAQALKGLDLF